MLFLYSRKVTVLYHVTIYRPIFVTSICCKLLEHIIYSHITTFLVLFLCTSMALEKLLLLKSINRLYFIEDLHHLIKRHWEVDLMFLDFAKAFDKVPHNRLLLKLSNHEIQGIVYDWIKDWLQTGIKKLSSMVNPHLHNLYCLVYPKVQFLALDVPYLYKWH